MTKVQFLHKIAALSKAAEDSLAAGLRAAAVTAGPTELADAWAMVLQCEEAYHLSKKTYCELADVYYPRSREGRWYNDRSNTPPVDLAQDAIRKQTGYDNKVAESKAKFDGLYKKVQQTKDPKKLLQIANLLCIDVGGEITGEGVNIPAGIDVNYLKPVIQKVSSGLALPPPESEES